MICQSFAELFAVNWLEVLSVVVCVLSELIWLLPRAMSCEALTGLDRLLSAWLELIAGKESRVGLIRQLRFGEQRHFWLPNWRWSTSHRPFVDWYKIAGLRLFLISGGDGYMRSLKLFLGGKYFVGSNLRSFLGNEISSANDFLSIRALAGSICSSDWSRWRFAGKSFDELLDLELRFLMSLWDHILSTIHLGFR